MNRRHFIKTAAVASLATGAVSRALARQAAGDTVSVSPGVFVAPSAPDGKQKAPFRLGTMYWLNPNYGEAEIERDVISMKENGIELIRSFLFWRNVEVAPGVFDFRRNDMLHRAAARHGLKIMETFEIVRYPFNEKAPEPTLYGNEQEKMCLDRPDAQKWAGAFVRAAVEHFKDSPALEMWHLNNEPRKTPCLCGHTLDKFASWLRARYGNTETMRRAYLKEYSSRIPAMPADLNTLGASELRDLLKRTSRTICVPLVFDFHDFMLGNLCDNVRWIGDIVRSIDTKRELHVNCTRALWNSMNLGSNGYEMAKVVDSMSFSVHPSHHFFRFDTVENFPCLYSASVDKLRSQCDGKDAWIGELQAGTTFYHANKYTPSPEEIKHEIYHAFGRGLKGVIFWEWQSWRAGLFEPGEFSLRRSADGGPTERSKAVAEAGAVLRKYRTEFENLQRQPAQVAIMGSKPTEIYKFMQVNYKKSAAGIDNEHNFAVYACFKALYHAGIPVDFVSAEQVEAGVLENYKTVFLPHIEILGAATAKKLEEFVGNGGWMWADGRCAFLDDRIFLREAIPGHGLSRVFGCKEADFVAAREGEIFRTKTGGELKPWRLKQTLEPTTGTVTASCRNTPVAVRNNYGKGCAELFGTYHCLGMQAALHDPAMKAQLTDAQKVIVDFVRDSGATVRDDITPGFEISRLGNEKLEVYVATNYNHNEARELTLPLSGNFTGIECPQGGALFAGNTIRRNFAPMETALFICKISHT